MEPILEQVKKDNVKFVQLQFTDILGVVKNLTIPAEYLEDAMTDGIWFDGSSIEGFMRIHESDQFLKPDLDTYAVIPWLCSENGNTARFICDVHTPEGEPFAGDPRYILKRVMNEAKQMGFEFNTGPELEFFIFKKENSKLQPLPHDTAGYFDLTTDEAIMIRQEMHAALKSFGINVEALHHEVAEGQHEIDFKYANALKTADNAITLRFALKAVAQRHGLHVTFMPKPIAGVNGSGMHTHQSLFDIKTGKNAFYDETSEYKLSDIAMNYMAGILAHVQSMCVILSPNVNSYKRLVPGYEAPVYLSWARINRSALIRIPRYSKGKTQATRCEVRCPDPSCNPYLAFAVMLKAGLDGMKRKLMPPKPIEEDVYEFTDEKLKELKIETLPATLGEALEVMQKDPLIKETLGDHTYEKFLESKQAEWDEYRLYVSQWELDKYLEVY